MNPFLVLCIALTFCYATSQSNYRTTSRLEQDVQPTSGYGGYSQPSLDQPKALMSGYSQQLVRPVIQLDQSNGYGQVKTLVQQEQKPNYGAEFSSDQQVRPLLDQTSGYSTNYAQQKPVQDIQPVVARPAASQVLVFPVQTRQSINPYGAGLQQRLLQQAQLQRSGYGSYGYSQQRPVVGYATYTTQTQFDVPQVSQTLPPTVADMKCQGKSNGDTIPFDDLKGAYTCVDDGKGFEIVCPKFLWWSIQVNRCEKKINQLLPPCLSNPCQNGGVCSELDIYTYKCDCPVGFEGPQCERDQRACAQNPCGLDGVCKGFRYGAALSYVCICNDGNSYGPSCQQAIPNPCVSTEEHHLSLAYTDKGFIMCDGDQFFVESCPATTTWDNQQKTCIQPDLPVVQPIAQEQSFPRTFQAQQGGYSMYQVPKPVSGYSQVQQPAQPLNDQYGASQTQLFDKTRSRHHHHHHQRIQQADLSQQGYGGYSAVDQTQKLISPSFKPIQQDVQPISSGYGASVQQDIQPQRYAAQSFKPIQQDIQPSVSGYGGSIQQDIQPQRFVSSSNYGAKTFQDIQPKVSAYSSNIQTFEQKRPTFVRQQFDTVPQPASPY